MSEDCSDCKHVGRRYRDCRALGCDDNFSMWQSREPRYTVAEIETYLHYHKVSHEHPATMINNPIKGVAAVTKRNREGK